MSILREWLEDMADGEHIEAVVIGDMGWGDGYYSERVPCFGEQPKNIVLTWDEALPWISYEFGNGYGAPSCNCIVAWTKSWVISVSQYDGSTSPFRVPRNPVAHEPEMPGGG